MVALNQASQLSNVPSGGGDGSPKDVVQCGVVARLLEEKEEEKKVLRCGCMEWKVSPVPPEVHIRIEGGDTTTLPVTDCRAVSTFLFLNSVSLCLSWDLNP